MQIVSKEPYRPLIPEDSCTPVLKTLMENCWSENPSHRPDYNEITGNLKILNGGKYDILLYQSFLQREFSTGVLAYL